jgi:hypothetical protein
MAADLPVRQSRALAQLMLQLHADFRTRHGLPPLPTAWTLLEHLEELRGRSSITDRTLRRSPQRVLGRALEGARAIAWEVLKPIFHRQAEVNRDVILALEALARDREESRHAQHALSARISELEAALADGRMRRGGGS